MTREEIEAALDSGKLEVAMMNGNWWKVRRNGKTKTWKRNPQRFRTPIKAGLRSYGYIVETDLNSPWFRIVP